MAHPPWHGARGAGRSAQARLLAHRLLPPRRLHPESVTGEAEQASRLHLLRPRHGGVVLQPRCGGGVTLLRAGWRQNLLNERPTVLGVVRPYLLPDRVASTPVLDEVDGRRFRLAVVRPVAPLVDLSWCRFAGPRV